MSTPTNIKTRFTRFVANAYCEDMGVNFQLIDTLSNETALQILEFIKPEFPDCTFSVSRFTSEVSELPALQRHHERLSDVLRYAATCERPGDTFLELIGFRHLSTKAHALEGGAV